MLQQSTENLALIKQVAATQPTATGSIIDLEAYFDRVGYRGERTASLDTLKALVCHHTQAIPFENLNPLLHWPVRLDLASLQQKLVREGRGGYCFEQNLLFSHVLQALGFQVTHLAGRVVWNSLAGNTPPRTHMILRVDLDGEPYIVDVGFGGVTLTGVLRLEAKIEQATPHELFRLKQRDDLWVMQAKLGNEWQSLYHFDLQKQLLIDYEVRSWYICTHPNSLFLNTLMAARTDPDRRYGLRNNQLTVRHRSGLVEKLILSSVADLRTTLETQFQLTLPNTPDLEAVFRHFIDKFGTSDYS